MNKRALRLLLVSCFALSAALQIYAQEKQIPVHKVLRIRREAVKPGRVAAHHRNQVAVPAALRKAGSNAHFLAMSSLSGSAEVWYIRNYTSFAGWEKSWNETSRNDALKADLDQIGDKSSEFLSGASEVVAIVREDLSRAQHDLTRLHYFGVTTVRVVPGHEDDFIRLLKASAADSKSYWQTYQVTAGESGATYLVLVSYKSLAELDASAGVDGGQAAIARARDEGYVKAETQLFKVEPALSYVVPEGMMEQLDPDFWTVKPAYAPPPAKKK